MPYGFIGDPATDENQFDPNLPVSGITGWTGTLTPEQAARLPWNAGVQPAGGMYDIGGNAQTLRNLGVDETTIERTIYEPEQMIQAGKTLLESAHNVPDKIIKQLEDQGRAEAKRFQNLVINNQSDIFAAGQATMVPWLNRVKQTAAEHRYRESELDKPVFRSTAGGGVIKITPAGKVEEIYAPKEKPEMVTVVEKETSTTPRVTRKMAASEYEKIAPPTREVKKLLSDYAELKSAVARNDLSFGPDWLGLSDRKRALQETETKIRQAGFDPETGRKILAPSTLPRILSIRPRQ